ncbi:hypothetical protein HQ314_17635 [Rhodococcus sp. BP-332]|uniref:hypothetical protein n=1 Tax=Rhodococcus sp. BP-332 TaxID=2739447 RepID=UPI001C9AC0C2|nr:hypothetical protein [Rhodococcus sp. BP-332]MBY6678741.1 hypothetical protein [Rhodococcus sp. BP-332]
MAVLKYASSEGALSFSIGVLLYGIAIALSRSTSSELLAVFRDEHAAYGQRDITARFIHRGLTSGLLFAVATAIAGMSHSLSVAIWLGIAITFQVSSDAIRTAFVVAGETVQALVISSTILAATLLGSIVNVLTQNALPAIIAWASGALFFTVFHSLMRLRSTLPFRPITLTFFLEAVVTTAASQIAVLAGTAVIGSDLAIVARVAATAFGVYMLFYQAIALLLYPAVQRRSKHTTAPQVWVLVVTVLGTILLVTSLCLVLATMLVDPNAIFGNSWSIARPYMLPYVLMLLAGTSSAATFLMLRVVKRTTASLRVRVASGVLQVCMPIAVGYLTSVSGFYVGAAMASAVIGATGLVLAVRYTKEKQHA